MRRHLFLRRQQRRHFLSRQFLLKSQPLVERILQQQAPFREMLGLPLEPAPAEAAGPVLFFWPPVLLEALGDSPWSLESTLSEDQTREVLTGTPAEEPRAEITRPASPLPLEHRAPEQETGAEVEPRRNSPALGMTGTLPQATGSLPESAAAGIVAEALPLQNGRSEPALPDGRARRSRIIESDVASDNLIPRSAHVEQQASEEGNNSQQKQELISQEAESVDPVFTLSPPVLPEQKNGAAAASELFAPGEGDRSPQAWLARLTRQAHTERAEQVKPLNRPQEPLSQRARALLRPLVGFDPAAVPIYRDARAARETTDLRADALSNGEAIEVAPGSPEETPEMLGLLAHELTHVAVSQSPRFIPPVTRSTPGGRERELAPELLDEEELALRVEQRVRQVARADPPADRAPQDPPPPVPGEPGEETSSVVARALPERGIWGNLPAPWEPLPDWLTNAPGPAGTSAPAYPAPFSSPLPAPLAGAEPLLAGAGPAEPGVRRAGTERSLGGTGVEGEPAPQMPASAPAQAPEADLDALARQVYSLLKRRLSVEQRRER